MLYFLQKQFLKEGETATDNLWNIPITYTTKTGVDFENLKPKLLFTSKSGQLADEVKTDDWIMFNIQQIGINSYTQKIC